ncbi:hypothetical protein GCM10022225_09200 [Plantactinospora mayteni]|uniref:DUF1508 domain-containing protein n=1 Tax=Plantactinospora mayteni TaxID=566021 RepID=A0ABQ4EHY5_9ACTN|nr:hypothetical protein [Plantactinospora mayteni]GIG94333.1 hypothetical protein Pma05_09060 [Plantactinospora mayteni]
MHQPSFVFLAMSAGSGTRVDEAAEEVIWMLISPNNRKLGRGEVGYQTYVECRAAVRRLREQHHRASALALTDEFTGQWAWRLELDGETVAISSRSYLRARECNYNLERFLAAIPLAEIVEGTRLVRKGRRVVSQADRSTGRAAPRAVPPRLGDGPVAPRRPLGTDIAGRTGTETRTQRWPR